MSVAPQDEVWTLEDLLELPDDGRRHELIWGKIVMSPVPTARHGRMVARLTIALHAACPPDLEVLSGSGVYVPATPVINAPGPDLTVARRGVAAEPYPSTHDVLLVAEVSLSTWHRDTTDKLDAYAAGGVPWHWLAGADGTLTVRRLAGPGYDIVQVAQPGTVARLEGPFPVELDPATLGA